MMDGMTIMLKPEQEAWLAARVARGDYTSVEEAARQLLDERIAERVAEDGDDLAWARADVEQARAEQAQGDVMSLDEHRSRNKARLAAHRR
jgi:antitoxin ParD1/3/4